MGVKPLYFFKDENTIAFSSEKRSLFASGLINIEVDEKSVFEFLSYQSTGYPATIIKGVEQVESGSYLKIDNKNIVEKSYWKPTSNKRNKIDNPAAIRKQLFNKMNAAVQKRMICDVPMGAFLSGGIDSSAVVALMSLNSKDRINTFNLSFSEKEYDESAYADIIAKRFNTNHTKYLLKSEDFLDQVQLGLDAMDSPSADGINTFVLSSAIRSAGLKVALSGIGGDELFAGYPGFKQFYGLNKLHSGYSFLYPVRKIAATALSFSPSNKQKRRAAMLGISSPTIDKVYPIIRQILSPSMIQKFVHTEIPVTGLQTSLKNELGAIQQFELLSQYSIAEYMGYTQHTLLKDADQMSMAVGLEIREPFFDHELVEYVLSLPDYVKFPTYAKQLMVEALEPLLPNEIVYRKKQGFELPWKQWMQNELQSFCYSQINDLARMEFIKKDALIEYWKRFLKNDPDIRWMELWQFVVLGYWFKKNGIH